jgi:acetyl esterase/lipase
MRRFGSGLILTIALAMQGFFAPALAGRPAAEAFGRLPLLTEVVISPSGRYLAAAQTFETRNVLAVYDMNVPTAKAVIVPLGGANIVNIFWKSDERLLYSLRFQLNMGRLGALQLVMMMAVDRDGRNPSLLMDKNLFNIFQRSIADPLPNDPQHVLMVGWSDKAINLYRINVYSGASELVETGTSDTVRYVTDKDGEARVRMDRDGSVYQMLTRAKSGSGWRKITKFKRDIDRGLSIVGISPSNTNIGYVIASGQDRLGLYEIDLTTAKIGRAVFTHPKVDVDAPIFDDATGALVGVQFSRDSTEVHYFDQKLGALQRGLDEALPNSPVRLIKSASTDRTKMVVYSEGPRDPGTFYYLDRSTGEMHFFGKAYPDLQAADLGEVKAITYAARDGVQIPAYLTLPGNSAGRNLPTVVMPHGGPATRDTLGFDWWAQFLANRGYAVLQPNYRGSDGYGIAWRRAGHGQWGKRMQDDVSDSVKYLIETGIADRSRICIMGASYGGYAALAGATLTPDLYACSISVAGVSDLDLLLSNIRKRFGKRSDIYTYWLEQIALSDYDDDAIEAVSPVENAKAVKCPILLIHGERDVVVDIEQSEDMDRALRRAGKSHKFVRLEGEDHFLSDQVTRVQMLKEIESFLAANLNKPPS